MLIVNNDTNSIPFFLCASTNISGILFLMITEPFQLYFLSCMHDRGTYWLHIQWIDETCKQYINTCALALASYPSCIKSNTYSWMFVKTSFQYHSSCTYIDIFVGNLESSVKENATALQNLLVRLLKMNIPASWNNNQFLDTAGNWIWIPELSIALPPNPSIS